MSNKTDIVDDVKKIQIERLEQIEAERKRLDALVIEKKTAQENLNSAAAGDDAHEYHEAKARLTAVDDAIEFYTMKLKRLNTEALFENSQAVMSRIYAAGDSVEREAMENIIPLLDKVYKISAETCAKFERYNEAVKIVSAAAGLHVAEYIPQTVWRIMQSVEDFTAEPERSRWV